MSNLPAIQYAPRDGSGLPDHIASNRDQIDRELLEAGAVLFRGFQVDTPEAFHDAVKAYSSQLLDYTYRSTPRKEESKQVYTSTDYPASEDIPMHNENSYSHSWPLKLWFYCVQPAKSGGATPVADSRRVLERLDRSLRERFAQRGVLYVRHYSKVMDLPWQEVFQTTDKAEVERFCRDNGIQFEWEDDNLTTRQVSQAIARHPSTGEEVWFNQANLFHPSSLPAEDYEDMLTIFGPDKLPRNALYGDGTPFTPEELAAIREAYEQEAVDVAWEKGDVLLIENMLAAHGRRPFTPPRKVLVAMSEAFNLVPAHAGMS